MAHRWDSETRSEVMSRIKGRDTKPELFVRSLIHRLGYRYRLHRKDLPGTPDLVFPARSKVIFVHGCFWHQHSDPKCAAGHLPVSRTDYWTPKLKKNVMRDIENQQALESQGWTVLVIWECELKNSDELTEKIVSFLD